MPVPGRAVASRTTSGPATRGRNALTPALAIHDDQGASSDDGGDAAAVPGRRAGRERPAGLGVTCHGP